VSQGAGVFQCLESLEAVVVLCLMSLKAGAVLFLVVSIAPDIVQCLVS
jgi:hypothetical protein